MPFKVADSVPGVNRQRNRENRTCKRVLCMPSESESDCTTVRDTKEDAAEAEKRKREAKKKNSTEPTAEM